jgi:hypothetical protein
LIQDSGFRSQDSGARSQIKFFTRSRVGYSRLWSLRLTLTLPSRGPTKREVVVPVKRDILGVTQGFFFCPKHAKQDAVQPEFKFLFPVNGHRLYLDIHRSLSYSIFR